MPIGITLNAACILVGGILGWMIGRFIPNRMTESLSLIFGYCSVAIGVTLIMKIHALPAVALALILGTILGESVDLERHINNASIKLKDLVEKVTRKTESTDNNYITRFVSLLMLFCTGSIGILGALTEGMTGDFSVLLTKSVMDFFASGIFVSSMGLLVITIAIPQFLLFLLLYLLASFIMPLTDPNMIANFMACGGVIALITGLRICEIKIMRVTNTLPALLFIMPITWIWDKIFIF